MSAKIHVDWTKAVVGWLAEARYAWLATSVTVVALSIALRAGTPEPVIRITGLALQILGVATVAWGIAETRALYGHKSLLRLSCEWVKRFPLNRRDLVLSPVGASSATSISSARGYQTHTAPMHTVDDRLEALEKNILAINGRISATQNEIDEELEKLKAAVRAEGQIRQQEVHDSRKLIEVTATGGVHISAIGAVWLFVGVILSTAAVEISNAMAR